MEMKGLNNFLRALLGYFNRWCISPVVALCRRTIKQYLPLIRSNVIIPLRTIYSKPTTLKGTSYKIVYRRKFAVFPGRPDDQFTAQVCSKQAVRFG
jgi:hypothetical protein